MNIEIEKAEVDESVVAHELEILDAILGGAQAGAFQEMVLTETPAIREMREEHQCELPAEVLAAWTYGRVALRMQVERELAETGRVMMLTMLTAALPAVQEKLAEVNEKGYTAQALQALNLSPAQLFFLSRFVSAQVARKGLDRAWNDTAAWLAADAWEEDQ